MHDNQSVARKSNQTSPPQTVELTPEQIAFARMLGDVLARRWGELHSMSTNSARLPVVPPPSTDSA